VGSEPLPYQAQDFFTPTALRLISVKAHKTHGTYTTSIMIYLQSRLGMSPAFDFARASPSGVIGMTMLRFVSECGALLELQTSSADMK